jgi:hypothetical protein
LISKLITRSQVAISTFFEALRNPGFGGVPSTLTSTDVQNAIEEVSYSVSNSASPGFSWGRSGSASSGTWLQNETVPSNITGRNFPFYNGSLTEVSVSNESVNTFSVEIYEHDGTTYTLLATVSLTAQRSNVQSFTGVSVTKGLELAVKVSSGSGKNIVVQAILRGTSNP